MGFFSDLKEDLSQAVNELMPEEEQIRTGEEQPAEQEPAISIDEMLKNIDEIELPEEESEVNEEPETEEEPKEEEPAAEEPEQPSEPVGENPDTDETQEMEKMLAEMLAQSIEEEMQEEPPAEIQREEYKGAESKMEAGRVAVDETSVITAGVVITGDVATEGSIDVIGTVNGNINALGKLNITGHITGNSKAAEIYAEGAKISGEVVSEGAVKIGTSSVIIGNITATSAAVAGAVKGDIDVRGPVILDASAIVMGNIKSKSVQINNGAVIEGMCSQCYADVNPTSFFDEYKVETRKSK